MKILRASPKAAAVRNELLRCVRNFEGPASEFEISKLGLNSVLYLPVGVKLGVGFKLVQG
jgi:hypothetical protein